MNDSTASLRERYSRATALRHERLYGRGYQGPASEEVFRDLAEPLSISSADRILDVGCGLGGDVFRLSNYYRAEVVGIDASPDMIAIANERLSTDASVTARVRFICANIVDSSLLNEGPFSVVWSRDAGAFLDLAQKRVVWRKLFAAQPSGGRVLVTDYCLGKSPHGDTFEKRMKSWGQHMATPEQYKDILGEAGYVEIVTTDRTADLLESQREGLSVLHENEMELVNEFGRAKYLSLVERWEAKISHSSSGQLMWMQLTAEKPSA